MQSTIFLLSHSFGDHGTISSFRRYAHITSYTISSLKLALYIGFIVDATRVLAIGNWRLIRTGLVIKKSEWRYWIKRSTNFYGTMYAEISWIYIGNQNVSPELQVKYIT